MATMEIEVTEATKKKVETIAAKEKLTNSEVANILLRYSAEQYEAGNCFESFRSHVFMDKFRSELKNGDTVIAGNVMGVIKNKGDFQTELEVSKNVTITVLTESITDKQVS